MITTLDDYPIHQTPQPVAVPSTSDRNFYDRFWFSGFVGDGSLYFSVAMGFYPNRHVMDAGFSVLLDGRQHCLHVSGALPQDRAKTRLGPIEVQTIVPMRRHRVIVSAPERGFEAELAFEGGTGTHEEERQILHDGVQLSMDITRMTQFGSWSGWIRVKGRRIEVDPRRTNGTRDRSWGIRPCGENGGRPHRWASQFYFGWSQTFWKDFVLHGVLYADRKGDVVIGSGGTVPRVPKGDEPAFARDTGEVAATPVGYDFHYVPNSRRLRKASLRFRRPGGEIWEAHYEPIVSFAMAGVGYFHPSWGHGCWKGEYAIDDETWVVADMDISQPHLFHVQQVCKVTLNGDQTSVGILEHAAFGPHDPSGFKEFGDTWKAPV